MMKNNNLRQYPVTWYTLLINNFKNGLKKHVLKILFEYFMQQLHNELPDKGVLIGAINLIRKKVIISYIIIRYITPTITSNERSS